MPLDVLHHALNVGVVDTDKLHRVDLLRMRLAAEIQTNLMTTAVGRAFFRPGTEYLETIDEARLESFIAGVSSSFILVLGDETLQIVDGDTDALVTRPAVTASVTNGDFSSGTGWTLASSAGQTSSISGGKLTLSARAHGGKASCTRSVTVNETGVEHALRIVVDRGPVTFRCGSSSGLDDYIAETTLRTGTHSLAFTPSGDFHVYFSSERSPSVIVDSIQVESSGVMELPTIWGISDDVPILQMDQSLDVMFVACDGLKQQRIERRGDHSWSVCDFDSDDGPFLVGRTAELSLTPSVTEGNGTLTASAPFFKSGHVGALFRIYHEGQRIETYLAGLNEFTPTILVTGVNETDYNERDHSITIAGTWVGTIRTQRSFDGEDIEFHDFRRAQSVSTVDITGNATYTNDDNEDNAITWYRWKMVAYTSGEAQLTITYDGGGGYGICRVTAVNSSTEAAIEVLTPFLGKVASKEWQEGAWSGKQGYPAGVRFSDGRLWWLGADRVWGSISDAFDAFDEEFEGDAGPILRSIALGGRNYSRWGMSLGNLIIGTDSRVVNARASTLDEIITPSNLGLHEVDRVGVNGVAPLHLSDDRGLFVAADGSSLYEVSYSQEKARYVATEFSKLCADLFSMGVVKMDRSTRPDQRIWVATEDDNTVCAVYEPMQEILAPIPIDVTSYAGSAVEQADVIESVCVLPNAVQDRVYFVVRRTVNGSTVRYLEKLALDTEARPATVTKCVDSHVSGTGAHSATISLPHLIGRTVVAWVDGAPVYEAGTTTIKEFTVDGSGEIELPTAPTAGWAVGLKYRGRYKSARIAYALQNATSMLKNKTIGKVGFILADYARAGLRYGGVFDDSNHPLDALPLLKGGKLASNVITGPDTDEQMHSLYSPASLDARVCFEVTSPHPLSVNSLIFSIENLQN